MRLIDADELLNKCYHAYPSIDHYCTSRSVVDAKDIINAPTIDAEPVLHGHWIEHYAFGCFHYDCSICDDGFAIKNKQKELPNYCANCGAKMDGERRNA